jgi:hypothetical protein
VSIVITVGTGENNDTKLHTEPRSNDSLTQRFVAATERLEQRFNAALKVCSIKRALATGIRQLKSVIIDSDKG